MFLRWRHSLSNNFFFFECVEKAAKLGRRFISSEKWLNVFHLFQDGFETLHLRLYQLDRLIEEYLPDLWNHLVENCIENHMYASQWFLTLFTAKFPLFLVFHILDVFLYQGMETIFQVSFKMKGKEKHFWISDSLFSFVNTRHGATRRVHQHTWARWCECIDRWKNELLLLVFLLGCSRPVIHG
jgi:hypothetical protein